MGGGEVFMWGVGDEEEDDSMNGFLGFVDGDMEKKGEKSGGLKIEEGKKVVGGMEVKIDDEIGEEE